MRALLSSVDRPTPPRAFLLDSAQAVLTAAGPGNSLLSHRGNDPVQVKIRFR
jgi:hypothetical protein